jgi:hypothetical protein
MPKEVSTFAIIEILITLKSMPVVEKLAFERMLLPMDQSLSFVNQLPMVVNLFHLGAGRCESQYLCEHRSLGNYGAQNG